MKRTLATTIVAIFVLTYLFGPVQALAIFAWTITGFSVISGMIAIYFSVKVKQAEYKAILYDARLKKYVSYKDGFGMIHLLNLKTDVIENLSVYPGSHHNSQWQDPHPAAAAAWFALVGKARKESPVSLLTESQKQLPNSFDFFELMSQVRKAYAIFGYQQVGKTTMVHHLVKFWQDKNIMPIVIGQKFDAREYKTGVMRFGPEKEKIVEGFNLIRQEAEARQKLASEGQSFGEMTPLPVIIEDATSLNAIVDARELEQFMRQLLTVYAARLIVVYLVVHGMDLASFGLRVRAALKNQLTCLYFDVPPCLATFSPADAVITASIGYRPQEAERYPVTNLPRGFAALTDDCQPALYSLAVDIPKARMSSRGHKILRLYGQDWTVSQIAEHVYGAVNSHNNGKVKDVLNKYGVPIRDARMRIYDLPQFDNGSGECS